MNFDYLTEAKKLISMLQSEKLDSFALTLQTVLNSSSNSTELLMGLRFHLLKIPSNNVSTPTLLKIQTLLKEIDDILQR